MLVRSFNTGVTLTGYNSATVASSASSKGTATPYCTDGPTIYSWRTSPPSTAANTKYAVCDLGSTIDLSGFQDITFWIYQPEAASRWGDNSWVVKLCSDAAGDTPVETITITNLSNNASSTGSGGHWVTYRKGSALSANVRSIALYSGSATMTSPSSIDIATFLCYTANPTVMAGDWVWEQDFKEAFQVAWIENGETTSPILWFTVGGSTLTNVTHGGCLNSWTGLTLVARRPVWIKAADMTNGDYTNMAFPLLIGDTTGTSPNYTYYEGGYNTSSGLVDGITFYQVMHGLNDWLFYRSTAVSEYLTRQVLRNLYLSAAGGMGGLINASSGLSSHDMRHSNCAWFNASGAGGIGYYNGGSSGYPRLFRWEADDCYFMGGNYYMSQTHAFNGVITNCRFHRCNIGVDTVWGWYGTVTWTNVKFRRGTLTLNCATHLTAYDDGYDATWDFQGTCVFEGGETKLNTYNRLNAPGRWHISGSLLMKNTSFGFSGRGVCDATITESRPYDGGTYSPSVWTALYHPASKYGVKVENYTNQRTITAPTTMTNVWLKNCAWPGIANGSSQINVWSPNDVRIEDCTFTNTINDGTNSPIRLSMTYGKRLDIFHSTFYNFNFDGSSGAYIKMRYTTVQNNSVVGHAMYPIQPGPRMVLDHCSFPGETYAGLIVYWDFGDTINGSGGTWEAPYIDYEDAYRATNSPLTYFGGDTPTVYNHAVITDDFFVVLADNTGRTGGPGWLWMVIASSYERVHDEEWFRFPVARVAVKAGHLLTASIWFKRTDDVVGQDPYPVLWAEANQLEYGQPKLRVESHAVAGVWTQASLTYTPAVDGILEFCVGAVTTYFKGSFAFDDFTATQA
jgi:hypothetical protein